MLSTDGDSDRCFANFYFYQGNSTAPIKTRFPNHKTALQSENGVFYIRKRRFLHHKTAFYNQKTAFF